MTWLVIGLGCGFVLTLGALHLWARTGDRRQLVAKLQAEERLRQIQIEGLHRLAEAGEVGLRSTRLGFTDADVDAMTRPSVVHAPLRAMVHRPDEEVS